MVDAPLKRRAVDGLEGLSKNGVHMKLRLSPRLNNESDLVLSPSSHTPVRDAGWSPADLAKGNRSSHAPFEFKPRVPLPYEVLA